MALASAEAERSASVRDRRPRGRVAKTVQVIGELLITFGLIVLLFIFYELVVTGWKTAGTQRKLSHQLANQWQPPPPVRHPAAPAKPAAPEPVIKPVEGRGFAIIRIPRFGAHYHWVVVEGVGRNDLEKGPGHYPGTALPGQIGNVVISGHRTTYGAPFNRLAELKTGDAISLQVGIHTTYTYHVVGTQVVDPDDTAVILPVPGNRNATPTKRLLTLTTCNPEYSAAQRLIITAQMTGSST
jgi:sortase A